MTQPPTEPAEPTGSTAAGSRAIRSTHEGRDEDPSYGFPVGFWRALEGRRPPGLPDARVWRSPLRGPWLTSVFGAVLLMSLPVVIITGLLDYIAYGPQFGQAKPVDVGWLKLPTFNWPTRPSWLFAVTQGAHVVLGLVIVPVVLAKLWSVVPRLFSWPASRSIAQLLERLSLLMLVGGILFEIATGLLNIQYDYIFGFSFYTAHYFGAWVFMGGFVAHVIIKLPTLLASLRSRSLRAELRTSRAQTEPEPADPDSLVAVEPDPATISRRGVLALVGAGSGLVALLSVGQVTAGFLRPLALLLPRGRSYGNGPTDFQVNRTAESAAIDVHKTGASWKLSLSGGSTPASLDRETLLAMPQHTALLPIACVEGWSTTQTWTGVRLGDLAALAGLDGVASATVSSLQQGGSFNVATIQGNQVLDPDALLALRVNGADLSLDHGFPARIIVPALPGVHNTKWVRAIEFRSH